MKKLITLLGILLLGMALLAGCGDDDDDLLPDFFVISTAFSSGDSIPVQYTCDATNISPPFIFSTPDESLGVQSFALILDDPDAPGGTFVHWVLYNLPATTTGLAEGLSPGGALPAGSAEGINDFGNLGYGGPCPPVGSSHRYYFRFYALDTMLNLPAGATRAEVDQAMNGRIVAQDELMGVFAR